MVSLLGSIEFWDAAPEKLRCLSQYPALIHFADTLCSGTKSIMENAHFLCYGRSSKKPLLRQSVEAASRKGTLSHDALTSRQHEFHKFLALPTELQLQVLSHIGLKQLLSMRCTSRYMNSVISEHACVLAAPFERAARRRLQDFIDYWLDYSRGDIDFLEALSRFLWRRRISTDLTLMGNLLKAFARYWLLSKPNYQRLRIRDPRAATALFCDICNISLHIFRAYIGFQFDHKEFKPPPGQGPSYVHWRPSRISFVVHCSRYLPPEGFGVDVKSLEKWHELIKGGRNNLPAVMGDDSSPAMGRPDMPTLTGLNFHPRWSVRPGNEALFFEEWKVPTFPVAFNGEFAYVVATRWAWNNVQKSMHEKELDPLHRAAVLMEMSIW